MARERDFQSPEDLSREAESLLAEYFRIRREYNALDKHNPDHADRRAVLKGRYYELDRKYTSLVKEQDRAVESEQGPASRADVLWRGALDGLDAPEPSRPFKGESDADGPWVELTTPPEGAATDAMFEEALKQVSHFVPPAPEIPPAPVSIPEPEDELPEIEEPVVPPTIDALRELTEHLQSGDLNELQEAAEEVVVEADAAPSPTESISQPVEPVARRESKVAEIYTTRVKPVTRPLKPPRETPDPPPIACPSCGEMLKPGTEACTYCGARLITGDTAEGLADTVPPHLQLRPSEPEVKSNFGAKLIISMGWLLVLAAAAWLIVRNAQLWTAEIDAWLDANGVGIVKDNLGGGILGIALALLGGTLVGIGVFAGRFIRVVVPMHELARNGRVETIERLIVRGDDIDVRDARGCTPLHFAVVAKQREVTAVLVGNGADLNAHNDRGDTPLHMAVANRDHALVQYLINKGADLDATNSGGSTLMHVAALVGDVGLLKLFVEKGLPIDRPTKVGFTPLHFAAQSGHDDAIKFLLDHGADPNAASEHGTTPIFPAARNGHLHAVRQLIDAGADYNTRRGHDFESPLGIARIHKRREVYDYLESIGAAD